MVIKAQVFVDFIAEFIHNKAPEPERALLKVENLEKLNKQDNLAMWKLFVDGSSNQHGCGAGLIL